MTFKDLNITEPILKAIEEKGYANPTPIQVKAIPAALTGKDILGCAQTGTGKTAAFAIPIIQHLQALKNRDKSIKALILTPTRELALQISECIDDYAKYTQVRHGVIFGGVNQRAQVNMLHKGVDILVATPGRLLDLMNQDISIWIMCDTSYWMRPTVWQIWDLSMTSNVCCQKEKQTLFFSATMPDTIIALTNSLLKQPVKITITPKSSTVDTIEQTIYFCGEEREK